MIFIYHHLGLGDHIICNGLVRELYKIHEEIFLYCKCLNSKSIKYMYRDLKNLHIIKVEKDEDVVINEKTLKIGFEHLPFFLKNEITWDQAFYKQCNIDFEKRWSSFHVERDKEREIELFKKLNYKNEKFSLVHEAGSDNVIRIKKEYINKNLKEIKIKKEDTDNIFDYMLLIEKAAEIHCIDSSFKHLCDSIKTEANLFYHNTPERAAPHKHKNNWKIL